ncbi:MAG: hypothetical protein CVT83_07480 [Alphaproteobacteria bacterium HGW-Alphaproteobacteria-5]|nr:MAG: hypothetical protein CVT83_07480 [Alphaproteobacteria bacterium HGW-Alphaproteobacteria-5]
MLDINCKHCGKRAMLAGSRCLNNCICPKHHINHITCCITCAVNLYHCANRSSCRTYLDHLRLNDKYIACLCLCTAGNNRCRSILLDINHKHCGE